MEQIDIKKCNHIVFGEEHHNPLGIIRSLGENGIKPIAIIIKSSRRIASMSKYISKLIFVDSLEEGYKIIINNYRHTNNKSFIYTSDDTITSYLDNHYNELKKYFYFFNAGKQGRINFYMDKNNIGELARRCGLEVPKTWHVKTGNIPKDLFYPVITKTCNSKMKNWKSEMHICHNEEELLNAYKLIKSKDIILQEYISKKNEIAVSGVSSNKGKNVLYTVEINFNYLIEDSYSYYMTVKNFEGYNMIDKMNNMFKEIGFEGIFEIEFLLGENGKKYFLEINFRPTAWNYSSTVAKMPMPIIWAESMANKHNAETYLKKFKRFNAILDVKDYIYRVRINKMSTIKWIVEYSKSKCKYYFNWRDIKPFYSLIKSHFKKMNL